MKASRGGKNRSFFLLFITRQNKFDELLVGIRTTIHYPGETHLFGAYVKDKSLFGNFPIFDKISNMSLRFLLDNY